MLNSKVKISFFAILFLMLFELNSFAQIKEDIIEIKGEVIYLTVDEVYFNIGSKDGLAVNDTVFIFRNNSKIDSLLITDISERYSKAKSELEKVKNIKIGDVAVVMKVKKQTKEQPETKTLSEQSKEKNEKSQVEKVNLISSSTPKEPIIKSHGRISIQNYALFSQSYNYQRPALLLIANFDKVFLNNLKINAYSKIENNSSKTTTLMSKQTRLLLYQFYIEYQLENLLLSLGRIFPYSNPGIGGTDGIQLMMRNQTFSFGLIAGTQPQIENNTSNLSNPKFSFFIAKDFRNPSVSGRMSVSYSKVLKNKKLEEEFIYIQNFARVSKLVDIYLSAQVDLNQSNNGQPVKKLNFRNLFTSFSFTPFTWFRFSLDLNTYKNAYLFETMKSLPDSIIDKRFRNDLRGRFYINLPFDITLNFIIGELGGIGLIRNAVEQAKKCIEYIAKNRPKRETEEQYDVVIIGAGPAGLTASLSALKYRLKYITLEQEDSIGGTILHYPRQKIVMTFPVDLPLYGRLKFYEVPKEMLYQTWVEIVNKFSLNIKMAQKVVDIIIEDGFFKVLTEKGESYRAKNVVLALGRRGSPRKLGVPGEDLGKVSYKLIEAENYNNCNVLVVGGGDSAVESAMALANQINNDIVISYRGDAFKSIKPRNRERIQKYIQEGKIKVIFNSNVKEIKPGSVILKTPEGEIEIKNDYVFIFIGGTLPYDLLKKIGIKIVQKSGN